MKEPLRFAICIYIVYLFFRCLSSSVLCLRCVLDYIYLLSAHLYSFIVGDECKKRARVQMCARSVCSCRYNLAGLFDMIKSAYKVLERNIDYYSKKAVGSCAHAAAAQTTRTLF